MIGRDHGNILLWSHLVIQHCKDTLHLLIHDSQRFLQFRRVWAVLMTDEISRFEVDENHVGGVIQTYRFLFEHFEQRLALKL